MWSIDKSQNSKFKSAIANNFPIVNREIAESTLQYEGKISQILSSMLIERPSF